MSEHALRRLRPGIDDVIDLSFGVALSVLAVIGFRASFGDAEELTVGVPAVLAGASVGYLLARLGPPMLAKAAIGTVAFFLFGGVLALRGDAIGGVLPSPGVVEGLIDGAINGWARLITSVPPAPPVGNLLAIPYLAGFAGAALTVLAAYAWPRLPVCVVPPAVVLAVTVLFGVEDPVSLILQGALFGAIVVAWLAIRVRRVEPALVAGGRRRLVTGLAMLGAVGIGALAIGPSVPGAEANERYILREQVSPPFDPSQYPSPLARFRKYHGEEPIEDVLFTVEGLPPGQVVRFAVMDDYDGYVWRASPPGTSIGGAYQRVGGRISGAATGTEATVRFEMGALASIDAVWIPTAGSPTSIRFEGERSEALTEEFRFNRQTETAASPLALMKGDRWVIDATFTELPSEERLRELPAVSRVAVDTPLGLSDAITGRLVEWVGDIKDPFGQVAKVEDELKGVGAYNDGVEVPVPAGHGLARLIPFLEAAQPQGNGEQYAAAVAYAARALGIPSRVVLEFDPPDRGGEVEVTAEHARAMVEIALAGEGWIQVGDPTPSEDDVPEPSVSRTEPVPKNEVQPPPPTTVPPPNSLLEDRVQDREVTLDDEGGSSSRGLVGTVLRVVGIALVPALLLMGPIAIVMAIKARRSQRRRTAGLPVQRIAGGWSEIIDIARDVGAPAPATATRREWARLLPAASAFALAGEADRWTFGSDEATDADAKQVWNVVDVVRSEITGTLSRWQRFRAAVSLTSLRAVDDGWW